MKRCFIVPLGSGAGSAEESGEQRPLNAHPGMLAWHGARVLDPDTATTADEWPAPQSTVYRAHTLLLPSDLHEEPALGALNEVLAEAGMRLVPGPSRSGTEGTAPGTSPRAAVLAP